MPKKKSNVQTVSELFKEVHAENETPPQQDIPEELEQPEVVDAPPADDDKLAKSEDKYQRMLADFDNFRKRTAKEMEERHNDGIRAAAEKLLPVVDNFERALSSAENKEDNFYKGIEMIARQFDSVLEELQIKSIEATPGTPFDTHLHYAVAHVEDENFGENQVADVLQKGFIHKDRVIRPAMVKVAN